jgi:hypothetical protein
LRQLWNPYDHFAGFRALQFFPRDLFDRVRIALERLNFLPELNVFGIESVDVLAHSFNFILRPAHGNKSMRAKDIVHDQCKHEQA